MRLTISRALVALFLLVLAACGDGASDAAVASLPPLERIDGDSAAIADGFVKLEARASSPTTVREAYLERARFRRRMLQDDTLLARVPESLQASLDSAVADELQALADERRARLDRARSAGGGERAELDARTPTPPGTSLPPAGSRFAVLARPLSLFLPATAWAAGAQGGAESEPVVRERTTVTFEGATIRTRTSRREFRAKGRRGFEEETRATAEISSGGLRTQKTQTVRELVDVSYCPDVNGIADGRREYSMADETVMQGTLPEIAHIRGTAQVFMDETSVFTGRVDDAAELETLDARVEYSIRHQSRPPNSRQIASRLGVARGRVIGLARGSGTDGVVVDPAARRYVDLPRDLAPELREPMKGFVDIAMGDASLDKMIDHYSLARSAWRSGECLEIRFPEPPDPSKLRLGERTTFVPEVRHRFDAAASALPLERRASVGSIEGADSTAARATYGAPEADAPDASRFRGDGAEIGIRSVSRRGIADTTLRIASAEPAPEGYRVTVTLRSESAKWGVGSEYSYEATLSPTDEGGAEELVGSGTYRGFLLARPANCHLAATEAPERFDVSGKLEASGGIVDMNPFGSPKPSMMFVLGTLDWKLKPLYGAEGPFATTAEEREGIKGLGSVISGPPIALTRRVTTVTRTGTSESKCAGTTTTITTIRIERTG